MDSSLKSILKIALLGVIIMLGSAGFGLWYGLSQTNNYASTNNGVNEPDNSHTQQTDINSNKPGQKDNGVEVVYEEKKSEADGKHAGAGKSYYFRDFTTSWVSESRGYTEADGMLWVPQIKFIVKNTGATDINKLIFKAIFLDSEKVIRGDEVIKSMETIPVGYSKGPSFMNGTIGYKSDNAFVDMINDKSKNWRYDLFASESILGPWEKVKFGFVELPEEYKQMGSSPQ